jgi:hypothetical protein
MKNRCQSPLMNLFIKKIRSILFWLEMSSEERSPCLILKIKFNKKGRDNSASMDLITY